ncbi:hypothetical protein H5410_012515 [Solanum commersonii]|uniref:Uncharacterized protein n=1 Tax=Solanum commersonii TaxID=4109 RepID=A0A9J6ASK7_SOLCO|nr:hypothetical protein H5410_012515 [Solanum commersonii]
MQITQELKKTPKTHDLDEEIWKDTLVIGVIGRGNYTLQSQAEAVNYCEGFAQVWSKRGQRTQEVPGKTLSLSKSIWAIQILNSWKRNSQRKQQRNHEGEEEIDFSGRFERNRFLTKGMGEHVVAMERSLERPISGKKKIVEGRVNVISGQNTEYRAAILGKKKA